MLVGGAVSSASDVGGVVTSAAEEDLFDGPIESKFVHKRRKQEVMSSQSKVAENELENRRRKER